VRPNVQPKSPIALRSTAYLFNDSAIDGGKAATKALGQAMEMLFYFFYFFWLESP